jgi:hypothetical protein
VSETWGSRSRLVLLAAFAPLAAALACEPQRAGVQDAAPAESAPAAVASADVADPGERMARWERSRSAALRIPCRAIAVDGEVLAEAAPDGGTQTGGPQTGGPEAAGGAQVGGARLATDAEIPGELWLSLGRDARLVAKDPRTTRETSFQGPARVRACVAHREESWLLSGRFESAIGAGETPGAEEWVVTPFGVVRYLAAKLAVDVRAKDAVAAVGSGIAFLWLDDGVRASPARPRSAGASAGASASADSGAGAGADLGLAGADGGSGPALDDDAWLRMGEGEVTLSGTARPPTQAARASVDRCAGLAQRAQELAAALFAGSGNADGSTAKEQMRTRRQARAACAVAALRVDTLPPSARAGHDVREMSARLDHASAAWAAPPAAGLRP